MQEKLFSDVTDNEQDELLSRMHYELFIEEVIDQIDNPFVKSKTNFLEIYDDAYKVIKNNSDDEDFLFELKQKREETFELILQKIEKKFEFKVDREDIKLAKVTKALYDFFILSYGANLASLLVNFITKNKKSLVTELKSMKNKTRDVTYMASKAMYSQNDALIINNIHKIIFDLFPSYYEGVDFIDVIALSENDHSTNYVKKLFDNGKIECDSDLFEKFIEPLINREDGYSDITSSVATSIYSLYIKCVTVDIL